MIDLKNLEEVKELIEKWEIQKKIEEKFLQNLEALEWNDKAQIKKNFLKLWGSEEKYKSHLRKRIKDGHIKFEEEFIKKVFEIFANYTTVTIYKAPETKNKENKELWHKIFYNEKENWLVIIGEFGTILTVFKVEKEKLYYSLKNMEDAGYQKYEGVQNKQLKDMAKRILCRYNR